MPFEHPQEVADDYERLLDSNEGSTFRTIFPMESFERWNERFIYNIRNISFPLFNLFYCGKIDLNQLDGPDILRLLIAVNEIDIQILTNYIQEYLIINRDNYMQENSTEILEEIY
ncbi:hypothetical protein GLOIN_2v1872250 [Rhizophagus clarus]|uniref:BTB domain-containing protein n=1 Tax=Rhizophagus clarus TaxID=94130 RepID=A0A8H3R5Y7_9GLOM|nr:hypothetical protein GLOIN_2v1872250 [Rhizophagus clarus]